MDLDDEEFEAFLDDITSDLEHLWSLGLAEWVGVDATGNSMWAITDKGIEALEDRPNA